MRINYSVSDSLIFKRRFIYDESMNFVWHTFESLIVPPYKQAVRPSRRKRNHSWWFGWWYVTHGHQADLLVRAGHLYLIRYQCGGEGVQWKCPVYTQLCTWRHLLLISLSQFVCRRVVSCSNIVHLSLFVSAEHVCVNGFTSFRVHN